MKSIHLLVALTLVFMGCGEDKPAPKKGPKAQQEQSKKIEPAAEEEEEPAEEAAKPAEAKAEEGKAPEAAPEGDKSLAEAAEAAKTAAVAGDEELKSTVVATVNGKPIDIQEYADSIKKRNKGKLMRSQVRKNVVERMINEELIRQAIEEARITVADSDVAVAMDLDLEKFNAQKATMGKRLKTFQERVGLEKLLTVRGLIKEPTPEELAKEYDNRFSLKLDTVYFPLPPNAGPADKAKAVESAKGVLTAVQANPNMREAVKAMTDYNGRRVTVKPLFIKKGDERNKALWTVANAMQEKAFGGPVELPDAVVVFQLVKRNEPKETLEAMQPKLRKTAMTMRVASARHRLVEELRKNAKVEYMIKLDDVPLRPGMPGAGLPNTLSPMGRAPGAAGLPEAMRAPRMGVPAGLPNKAPGLAPAAKPAAPAPAVAPAPAAVPATK